jgi:hypothetical protein
MKGPVQSPEDEMIAPTGKSMEVSASHVGQVIDGQVKGIRHRFMVGGLIPVSILRL